MSQVRSLQTGIKLKDTPIGKIPVDWEVLSLSQVTEINMGQSPSSQDCHDYEEGLPFYQGNADFGPKYPTARRWCKRPLKIAQEGDILISVRAPVGEINITPHECCIGRGLGAIRATKIDSSFLHQSMLFHRKALEKVSQGSTFESINRKDLSDFMIFAPSIPEQKKIAEILTTVDDAIEETDRIIEKTKELRKGLMQKLLTRGIGHKKFRKTEIGAIPEEWEVARLKEIANVRYGLGQPPALDDNGIPMVRATNIHEGAISKTGLISVKREAIPTSRNPFLTEGDIIVVRSGAYTGDIGLITKEWEGAVAGYDLVVTPSSRVNSIFLTNYLLSNIIQKGYFASLRERSAQPHLNSLQVEETPIALPPIPEQKKIAEVLSSTHTEIKQEEVQKTYFKSLKKSLMQVLLTGRVRVKLH
ncbi:MAG TPA: restriction endonuclease subunit S [Thermodesulfovibrionales bacterium]|nr:restriction endonuclease subunit S [Thermodesulfovibrionales bacterium]